MSQSEQKQVEALEQAILTRAEGLAEEFHAKARHQRDTILRDTAERLRLAEEREVFAAKEAADRNLRRKIQAGELKMQARLDQLRWELVLEIQAQMAQRMRDLRQDKDAYLDWLAQLVKESVEQLPSGELLAEVNTEDLAWLAEVWPTLTEQAAPGRKLTLTPRPIDGSGGIRLRDKDDSVRLDNRFEGRLARMEQDIHHIILRHLFPRDAER